MALSFHVCLITCSGVWLAGGLLAQPTPPLPSTVGTNGGGTNRVIMLHPISPIDYFKELLAMTPAQREKELANKTPEQKQVLLVKISEYESMSPEERDLRLRHTELRWYLIRLMRMPRLERITELASIPADKRALVEERLHLWDGVPLPLQNEFLKNEAMIQRMLTWEITPPDQKAKISPDKRLKLTQELAAWRALPEEQRQRMSDQFRQFFELNDEQKKKVLGTIPTQERQQMEQTLQKFGELPQPVRQKCMDSFSKFASMTADERAEFLKNAERWEAMTPSERRAWRELVNKLPPMPPMPPGYIGHSISPQLVTTNSIH